MTQLQAFKEGLWVCHPTCCNNLESVTMTTLYQSAVDNYPEDQAHLDAEFALDLFNTEGSDYYHQWLIKERAYVVHNVFDDDETLIKRYVDKFNDLTAPLTNLYM